MNAPLKQQYNTAIVLLFELKLCIALTQGVTHWGIAKNNCSQKNMAKNAMEIDLCWVVILL